MGRNWNRLTTKGHWRIGKAEAVRIEKSVAEANLVNAKASTNGTVKVKMSKKAFFAANDSAVALAA